MVDVGVDIGSYVFSTDGNIKIPIPFTNYKIEIGGSGYAGGIGIATKIDFDKNKLVVKAVAIIGAGLEIGIE